MPDISKSVLQRIQETSVLYKHNASLQAGDLDIQKEGKFFSDSMLIQGGRILLDVEYPQQKFMLGSISKLFIFRALADKLSETNIAADIPIFPINSRVIREVIHRGHLAYILEHTETYAPVISWLDQFNLPKKLLLNLQSIDIAIKNEAIAEINKQKLIDWDKPDFPDFKINFSELCHWTLRVSADAPLAVAKKYYEQNFGGYSALQLAVATQVPSLEITESTANFQHWLQNGPNTVQLKDLTQAMDKFATEVQTNAYMDSIHAAVTNNPIDFGFSISGSEQAKAWQFQGYQVIEKTGFYPTVIWIRNLAEQGFPAHMAISSTISLISPTSQCITGGLQMSVEIALPATSTEVGYPDESSPAYQHYIESMKAKYFPMFRSKLIDILLQAT